MASRHVIVDGSNLATEGRSMPSLAQLDQAVREFIAENPTDAVTVVVDASFGHRIDPSELPTFEAAEAAGEVVSPPAGAIGRGDAFLLRIAEKTGATVLSNDSFQEFHGEHAWLFDKGRLIGGKPVPGVGWIFMDRTPVRGAKSREVTKEAKRKKRTEGETAPAVASGAASAAGKRAAAAESKAKARPKAVDRAIARATEEVVEPKADAKSRRRRGGAPPAEAVNEPLAFITFIAAHPLGSDVIGSVLEYSSHGAFVEADGARCYIPLSAMGDPAPRRAREVVFRGESRTFVVQAFDPQRRGIELALPGFAKVAGRPTAETVEAEIAPEPEADEEVAKGRPRKRARKAAAVRKAVPAATKVAAAGAPAGGPDAPAAAAPPAKKAPAAKKTAVKKAAAVKKAPSAKKAAAAKAAPARAVAVKKASKAPALKKSTPAKAPAPAKAAAKKTTATAAKSTPAKATPAAKRTVPVKAATAARKAATVKTTGAAKRRPPATKPPAG
jgi:hypothetical protein